MTKILNLNIMKLNKNGIKDNFCISMYFDLYNFMWKRQKKQWRF